MDVDIYYSSSWHNVWHRDCNEGPSQSDWHRENVDISSYVGGTIKIRFTFDTIDGSYNNYEGWYIDNIRVMKDTDNDGWGDYDEAYVYYTNPNSDDTDSDGINDPQDIDPLVDLNVTVLISEVKQLDPVDNWPYGDADFYWKVWVNGVKKSSTQPGEGHDKAHEYPKWFQVWDIPDDQETVTIKIELWDDDLSDDDQCDISKNGKDVDITYNLKTGIWTGDDYLNDGNIYGHASGEEDGGAGDEDDCEIWFYIYQSDYDEDYLPYWSEIEHRTDPTDSDTDNDGAIDGVEVFPTVDTDPNSPNEWNIIRSEDENEYRFAWGLYIEAEVQVPTVIPFVSIAGGPGISGYYVFDEGAEIYGYLATPTLEFGIPWISGGITLEFGYGDPDHTGWSLNIMCLNMGFGDGAYVDIHPGEWVLIPQLQYSWKIWEDGSTHIIDSLGNEYVVDGDTFTVDGHGVYQG